MPVWRVQLKANVAQKVCKPNPLRKSFTIDNVSTADVYWGPYSWVATAGPRKGFLIRAAQSAENRWHKGEVWVISASDVDIEIEEMIPEIEEIVDYLIKRKAEGE